MPYTPELSKTGSAILRRLAWFRRKPMTVTLEEMVEIVAMELNEIKPGLVCRFCKDKTKCNEDSGCIFNTKLKIVTVRKIKGE